MAQRTDTRQDLLLRASEATVSRATSNLRDARRARNHKSRGFLAELRCECARPECRATFPVVAQAHRQRPEQFVVVPDHAAGETVVRAADRFFVVEPPGMDPIGVALNGYAAGLAPGPRPSRRLRAAL
ncbi:MAG TPA: hypothetical protein VJ986_13175 [Gaiellaceae bacterium]|nr:hypothetical protein [Gaiellaceae bacterium]